ncbi:hypothetical protein K439DRAFT_917371 [Ramaria rubella]|nr:hypothetical protein K439DRAFT_917371 [Ramaria rubella]
MCASTPNCTVCNATAVLRCSVCRNAWYCGQQHQKQAWPEHMYFCHEPFQMGLYAAGQSDILTPVFIPVSTGKLETIPGAKLAKLLSCPVNNLKVAISPISTLFKSAHRIVCVYNAGEGSTAAAVPLNRALNAPNELCSYAMQLMRPLATPSLEPQITGCALFFYLESNKDLLVQPDFSAAKASITAWNRANRDCSARTLKKLTKAFERNLSPPFTGHRIDYFNAIVFPALEANPFISKHPCERIRIDERFCHFLQNGYVIGETINETRYIPRTPMRGNLPNRLVAYTKYGFRRDGSPPNKSIQVVTKGKAKYPWCGNIVVLKQRGRSEMCIDATGDDVKAAIEYFKKYST